MAASVLAEFGTGASVTWATAEGGMTWNRSDSLTDTTTPVPVPTATGTNYSWVKHLGLVVTATSTTHITNRRIQMTGTSLPSGMVIGFKDVAAGSYAQSTSTPTAGGSDALVLATYTTATTGLLQWDNTSVITSSNGLNGDMVQVCLGVGSTYAGGAGTAIAMPSLNLVYDEA